MRRVASSNEFFDILDKIGNGKFVTIGYVAGANLNLPTVKRKNPLTNRMKSYADYSVFGSDEEIGALVKISSYNFQYLNRQTVGKKYGEYKQSANGIRANFGLDPIADKQGYKQGTDWSPNGPEMYNGNNADLQSHSYNPQNMHGVKPKSTVYAVNNEGHIIKALSQEQIIPYLKSKREIDGVAALRKMEVEEDKIEDYINQINALKFKYMNFESNSILWIAATINGEKIVYINDNLNRAVDGINIRPEDFRAIARERYQIDLNSLHEMTMKKLKVLAEMDWRTYDSAREKAEKLADETPSHYEKERRNNQADAFRKHANSTCDKQYGIDKIKQRERDHNTEVILNKTKTPFKHTNGELKRLEKQSRDVQDYYNGKQHYKDGKWINKESKERNMNKDIYRLTESELKALIKESVKKVLKERIFSPDELDDKAFMNDYWADRERQMEDDWKQKNIEIRKRYPGHSKEWYDAMLDTYQIGENKEDKKKALTEIGDTSNGQYAMGKLAARQQYRDKNSKAAWKTSWMAGDQQSNDRKGDNMNRAFHNGKMDGQKEFMKEESFQNNQGYSHFAVNKATNKIVNGWDYADYDPSELRQFKNDYFTRDLIDYDLDPKQYKIVTGKYLLRQGIDPNDNNNWANN